MSSKLVAIHIASKQIPQLCQHPWCTYEFDIITKDGKKLEVEVNAIDGTLGAPEEVLYDIGNY